jgi:hypothetical protein
MDEMTEHRLSARRVAWIATLTTGALLQACTHEPAPAASGARVYAADVTGKAKTCEVAKVNPAEGQTVETVMKLDDSRGWCGLPLRQPDAKPYDAGLLLERPAHGSVVIHQVGDDTRVDYTPDRGFTGSDSFVVKMIPGNAMVRISVSVVPATPGA